MSWAAMVKKAPEKAPEEAPRAIRYYIEHTEIVRDGDRTLLEQDMADAIFRVREQASRSLIHLLEPVSTGWLLSLLQSYYGVGSLTETRREYIKENNDTESKEESVDEEPTEESEVEDDFEY